MRKLCTYGTAILCLVSIGCSIALFACKPVKEKNTVEAINAAEVELVLNLKPVIDKRWAKDLCLLVSAGAHRPDLIVPVDCKLFHNRELPKTLDHTTVKPPLTPEMLPRSKPRKKKFTVPAVKIPIPEVR